MDTGVEQDYFSLRSADLPVLLVRDELSVIELKGRDRLSFLQGMITNDILSLQPGQGCRAALLNTTGHILADLTVISLENRILLITDLQCTQTVIESLDKLLISEKVVITDRSSELTCISLNNITSPEIRVDSTSPLSSSQVSIIDTSCILIRSRMRDPHQYDLLFPKPESDRLLQYFCDNKVSVQIQKDAFEIARIENGQPRWGMELTQKVLFPETGLEEAVSYKKGCYVGQEIIARIHARGHTNRLLGGVVFNAPPLPDMEDASMPAQFMDALIYAAGSGQDAARITSAAYSYRFGGKILALAYIRREFLQDNIKVSLTIDGLQVDGHVITYPFIKSQ